MLHFHFYVSSPLIFFPVAYQNWIHLQGKRHGINLWVRKILWERKWQSTPVFLPRKCHGQRSLEGCSPWGHKRVGRVLATEQQQNIFETNAFNQFSFSYPITPKYQWFRIQITKFICHWNKVSRQNSGNAVISLSFETQTLTLKYFALLWNMCFLSLLIL